MDYIKTFDQQTLTAMQPVIDILEDEYNKSKQQWLETGRYGCMGEVAYRIHTITNFGHWPYYPSNAFTIWD